MPGDWRSTVGCTVFFAHSCNSLLLQLTHTLLRQQVIDMLKTHTIDQNNGMEKPNFLGDVTFTISPPSSSTNHTLPWHAYTLNE